MNMTIEIKLGELVRFMGDHKYGEHGGS